jgi:hypothetical protein
MTRKARKPRIFPGDGDPRHGTPNGYINLFCDCDLCMQANTQYHWERMQDHDRRVRRNKRERERRAERKLISG